MDSNKYLKWHEKFDKIIISVVFVINEFDMSVYYKMKDNDCIFLCLYMDDILLFGMDLEIQNETKFEIKDMGVENKILELKLTRAVKGIAISQSHYVEMILEKSRYANCRFVCTLYDPSESLLKNKSGVLVS